MLKPVSGELPTRLIVPAQNSTSAFPKMGYLAIRRILDSNKVNYTKTDHHPGERLEGEVGLTSYPTR
jgi:hypothetical protein